MIEKVGNETVRRIPALAYVAAGVAGRATRSLNRLTRPSQFHDLFPDLRRQAMPECDKLLERLAAPTPFRQLMGAVFANII